MTEKLTAEKVAVARAALELAMSDIDLMARIVNAIEDTERVGEFKIHVCDNDCKIHIRTTWGPEINAYEPRSLWRVGVRDALDELDDIKPIIDPSTDEKE